MLYHSPIKHFIKGVVGRKNDAWYFDKMIAAFDTGQQALTNNAWREAEVLAAKDDSFYLHQPLVSGARVNPLYEAGVQLRKSLLQTHTERQLLKGKKVLIQQPPDSFSPGWSSWFNSLAQTMEIMGATVDRCWQIWDESLVAGADLILSQAGESFTKYWPISLSKLLKQNALFACYISFESNEAEKAKRLYERLRCHGVNRLLNAAAESFIENSVHKKYALQAASLPIASLPFAANPLHHYPTPWLFKRADFAFLGSANFDKAKRYYSFFQPIVTQFKGIIGGQGWPWSMNFFLKPSVDRWVYSQATLGLNLHLQYQIIDANEMNERTYILFACGTNQILDNPGLLKIHYPMVDQFAENPTQYLQNFQQVITREEDSLQRAMTFMEHTLLNHTVFNRMESFFKKEMRG